MVTKKKILLGPSSFGEIDKKPLEMIKNAGYKVIINPYKRKLTETEVISLGKQCVGMIAGLEPINSKVIDSCPKLKSISRVGVGMDNIDLAYANSKGITVTNTPDGPTQAVAEFTIAMTMALLRKITKADSNMRRGIWKKETGNLLLGKTIGVIGLGRIGKSVAQMFRCLSSRVIGFDQLQDIGWANKNSVEYVSFENLIQTADIITLHIPGNKDGSPIITREIISKIKLGSWLINISRGNIIDEKALEDALVDNRIKGAAIDVFSKEPYNGSLINLENVIVTPHIGSYAEEGKLKMEIDAAKNLINSLKAFL